MFFIQYYHSLFPFAHEISQEYIKYGGNATNVHNEAPRSELRGIRAKLRRSQPVFALSSFAAVRLAIHPCSKLHGILAKANKYS